jgi:hypothetical protein
MAGSEEEEEKEEAEGETLVLVIAGHSRPKDGVLSHAYIPAIHIFS